MDGSVTLGMDRDIVGSVGSFASNVVLAGDGGATVSNRRATQWQDEIFRGCVLFCRRIQIVSV
jgi:hypothetical protein